MKKIFYVMALVCAVALTGCAGLTGETPANSYTQLWPAYNSAVDLYGYINNKGEWAIPAQYSSASSFFSAGYAIVEINGEQAFINTNGEVQNCVSFDEAGQFIYGYSRAELNDKYGMINSNFEYSIQPAYNYLSNMTNDGIVTYRASLERFGFLDQYGNVLMKDGAPIFYEAAAEFCDGYCVVCSNLSTENERIPTRALINTKGEVAIPEGNYMQMINVGYGIVAVVYKDKDALEDRLSKGTPYEVHYLKADGSALGAQTYNSVVLNNSYSIYTDAVGYYSTDKVAWVARYKDGVYKFGYIDINGKEVIPAMYDNVYVSNEGYAWVLDDKTWKLLDIKTGIAAITCQTKTDNLEEYPLCGVHNGLTLIVTDTYSDNGEASYVYRWVEVAKNNTVFSWSYNKDKDNGHVEPNTWAPARKAEKEFNQYVFLK